MSFSSFIGLEVTVIRPANSFILCGLYIGVMVTMCTLHPEELVMIDVLSSPWTVIFTGDIMICRKEKREPGEVKLCSANE